MPEAEYTVTAWLGEAALGAFVGLCCAFFYGLGAVLRAMRKAKHIPRWLLVIFGQEPSDDDIYDSPARYLFAMTLSVIGLAVSLWLFHANYVSFKDYLAGRVSLRFAVMKEAGFPLLLLLTYIIPALLLNRYLRKLKRRPENCA